MINMDEIIVYSNSRNGLGIRILGAKRATNTSGIYIKQLLNDGLAQRDGRLKVGDQILSINDETSIGINRKQAVNILRSAASTNQVRLHVQHFIPSLSSSEYQQLLYDEKSTDDDNDNNNIHQILNYNVNKTDFHNRSLTTENEVRMRRSSRKYHQEQHRHSVVNLSFKNKNDYKEQITNDQILSGLDVSHDALQSLLNSRFKLIDLVDLLKKIYPKLLFNDQKQELLFIQQLSQTTSDDRITLKDFERQSSVILGEHINLLLPFYSSSKRSSTRNNNNNNKHVVELHREIALFRSKINELKTKIINCEKTQRLSEQVEIEYEDLLKFIYEQLNQYKLNEQNQLKQIRTNQQLIEKLFNYLSIYINKSRDQHILSQLKHEYEQQQTFLPSSYQQNNYETNILSNKTHQQRI
ncbi:unnamed protein product [Rotaria sp. Silwood1]|nr:unnamed protein product [Rotaria sp. Silwood1]CAF3481084.1 unnamed protein product [Rotaria sp. Silwood1]CAF3521672.1 unnamed protein product [Rotaria sp. Silwood1]CAF3553220.1 unnamed protein product [Rotaria sp. Silwood1]